MSKDKKDFDELLDIFESLVGIAGVDDDKPKDFGLTTLISLPDPKKSEAYLLNPVTKQMVMVPNHAEVTVISKPDKWGKIYVKWGEIYLLIPEDYVVKTGYN